jgi:hypothetical protein
MWKNVAMGILGVIVLFIIFVRAGNKKQTGAQEAATIINSGAQGFATGVRALEGR